MMTLHRPANVDEASKLKELLEEIIKNTQDMPLVFPVHPRTKKMLNELGIEHETTSYGRSNELLRVQLPC